MVLANLLRAAGVRLAILGACETAQRSVENVWEGVAPALVQAGVAAVVANQYGILDENASLLAEELYRGVLDGRSIDEALYAARRKIRAYAKEKGLENRDWGVPVLYLRVEEGIIFPRREADSTTPCQAPLLPDHFVPRPEVSESLKEQLLADRAAPGKLAIRGLGGIGKSVLAAALARDVAVQERFSDGVLWATLGQQPDILSKQGDWVKALRDHSYRPETVDGTRGHLQTLLQDKACLLVIDDVWDPNHIRPFLVGGPACCILITARRADVAEEVGAALYDLDVMSKKQALALLSARLRRLLAGEEQPQALALAKAVGYLPMALELAAVRVGAGVPWETLREALEAEVARLEALEGVRRRLKGHTRLEATLNLSLQALRELNEQFWKSFVWLGVLPEDVTISVPMAATLWEIEPWEAAEILELLWNDALLQRELPVRIEGEEWPAYRLHDLLHDLARRLLTKNPPQGLGYQLSQAHAALLERYRGKTKEGQWHTLPNDGYIHAHLSWHMEKAEKPELLHALLREETAEGRNGWFEARERLGQTAGFRADVRQAWEMARKNIGLQCRYALMQASLNSLSQNTPVEMLVALVSEGLWPATQGLAYAQSIPDPKQRSKTLASLLLHLPESERTQVLAEALDAARSIPRGPNRSEIIVGVALCLAELGRLKEAMAAIQLI